MFAVFRPGLGDAFQFCVGDAAIQPYALPLFNHVGVLKVAADGPHLFDTKGEDAIFAYG